jgi:hypothetical protein
MKMQASGKSKWVREVTDRESPESSPFRRIITLPGMNPPLRAAIIAFVSSAPASPAITTTLVGSNAKSTAAIISLSVPSIHRHISKAFY